MAKQKNAAAVALGRLGGLKGGKAWAARGTGVRDSIVPLTTRSCGSEQPVPQGQDQRCRDYRTFIYVKSDRLLGPFHLCGPFSPLVKPNMS